MFVSVVCAYAPTARAPAWVKAKFGGELQDIIDKIPSSKDAQ